MTGHTSQSDSRLTRRQRTILSLVAVVCIVLVPVGLTAAQSGTIGFSDDFEDNDLGEYGISGNGSGDVRIVNDDSVLGQNDRELRIQGGGGSVTTVESQGQNGTFDIQETGFTATWDLRLQDGSVIGQNTNLIEVENGQDRFYVRFGVEDTQGIGIVSTANTTGGQHQVVHPSEVPGMFDLGPNAAPISFNMTGDFIEDELSLTVVNESSGQTWDRTIELDGTVNSYDDYNVRYTVNTGSDEDPENHVWLDNVSVTGYSSEEVNLNSPNFMRPGESAHYSVEGRNGSVLENSTVTSSDNDTLTVYPGNNTLVATGNTSATPAEVTLTADYEGATDTKTVLVAKPTVENLDILPTWWKVNATVGDGMMLWLIVATLAAVVATRAATSFAGVGAYVMFMIAGWMTGSVSDGVVIAAILTGLFLGLNLAANVDTTIRGSG